MMATNIAWVRNSDGSKGETWNPITGCTPISEGCAHCYAKKMTERFGGDFSKVTLHPDRLEIPLHWRKPRRVFVCSMGDLFHEDVPDAFILDVFNTMMLAEQHTFQVLTKRAERMREWCSTWGHDLLRAGPLPNVWLGVSVENQARAVERIPLLLDTPAAVRFVSAEPLLGRVRLTCVGGPFSNCDSLTGLVPVDASAFEKRLPALDWVIVGGETGPGARLLVERCETDSGMPYHQLNIEGEPPERAGRIHKPCGGTGWQPKPEALEWVRDIRDQCQAAGVPFFLKQLGPRAGQGTELDGREWQEMPEVRA